MKMLCSWSFSFFVVAYTVIFANYCKSNEWHPSGKTRYLLYDVNPPEGFNLRRDVYMRIAILIKHLQDLKQDWRLVLPPWGNMYHWHSKDVGDQNKLPWSSFFDVPSMKKFIPVLEMHQFLQEYGGVHLDQVFFLQHYTSMWSEGKWEEKMDIEECNEELQYKTVMLDRAEVALHHMFGDVNYWQARRSMRFSPQLVKVATTFRAKKLNSTDEQDNTIRPSDWQTEKRLDITEERGGNYMCVHLRRRDFLWGRAKSVPSIIGAVTQISRVVKKNKLTTIFVATDATNDEIKELKSLLVPVHVKLFKPTTAQRMELKDGGVAIVEQIICSHAQVFYGTYESTFSFRIQEEREIMGFHPDSTFNRLCGDDEEDCTPPTRWRIEY
ncbi:hypothetical protein B566_EDAN013878 [Ephemera danica]|nr:hypothetical protein B566_EDAN013878 [Ephemera danica]